MSAQAEYEDDRYGMMRVHIAQRRGDLACERYTRNNLRAFAAGHGVTPGSLRKRDLATRMAYTGLISADGYLRDEFPATRSFGPEVVVRDATGEQVNPAEKTGESDD